MSGEDAECIKERYVRVAAIIIATIEGTKNSCVQEIIRTTRFRHQYHQNGRTKLKESDILSRANFDQYAAM